MSSNEEEDKLEGEVHEVDVGEVETKKMVMMVARLSCCWDECYSLFRVVAVFVVVVGKSAFNVVDAVISQ